MLSDVAKQCDAAPSAWRARAEAAEALANELVVKVREQRKKDYSIQFPAVLVAGALCILAAFFGGIEIRKSEEVEERSESLAQAQASGRARRCVLICPAAVVLCTRLLAA